MSLPKKALVLTLVVNDMDTSAIATGFRTVVVVVDDTGGFGGIEFKGDVMYFLCVIDGSRFNS